MLETIITIIASILISFVTNYIVLIRKTDNIDTRLKFLEKNVDDIKTLKIEEHMASIESRTTNVETLLKEFKYEIRELRKDLLNK